MEFSGNLWEQVVPILTGTAASGFNGSHGDGELFSNGNTNITGWISGVSSGIRGGAWNSIRQYLRTSDRSYVNYPTITRSESIGFRGVRTAL
jgi:formylglycine-generating enzyme required for sulfatase activity